MANSGPDTDNLQLVQRKKAALERALIIANDASEIFKLEEQIKDLDAMINKLLREAADHYQLEAFPSAKDLVQFVSSFTYDDGDRGVLQRVNCNRQRPVETFWDSFKLDDEGHHYQVYFITACDYQMPQQFSERLFWEFIYEEEPDTPFYRTHPDGRLIIDPLPLKRNLEKSKAEFEKYIARLFDLKGTTELSTFLSGEVVSHEHDIIFLPFRVQESKWQDWIPDYYRWIIAQFKQLSDGNTKFLLTFAHFSRNIHLEEHFTEEHRELLTALDGLEAEEPIAKHINRLQTIPVTDLEEWLLDMGISNLQQRQRAVEIIAASLPQEERERYQKDQVFNMTHIDLAQDIIYKHLSR